MSFSSPDTPLPFQEPLCGPGEAWASSHPYPSAGTLEEPRRDEKQREETSYTPSAGELEAQAGVAQKTLHYL